MTKPRDLTPAQCHEAIRLAIERRLPLVATIRDDDRWVLMHSRFVPRDPGAGLLCIEPPLGDTLAGAQGIPLEVPTGATIGVTFRRGHHKCMFSTTVFGRQRVTVSPELRIEALLIRCPAEVQQLQRRVYVRSIVPTGVCIPVEIASRPRSDASSPPAATVIGQLADLSAGGIRILVDHAPSQAPEIGRPFQITIRPDRRPAIQTDALFRHCQMDSHDRIAWGLQLVGLETTESGRHTLSAIADLMSHLG